MFQVDKQYSVRIRPDVAFLVPRSEKATCVRLLKEDSIDFDVVQGWLQFCQDQHTKTCCLQKSSNIPSLKLLDCETRSIVPALNHKYLTLSYLWGPTQKDCDLSRNLEPPPGNLPDTIEDAIAVTQRLGFRYLWIDRYCIDQESAEAHTQLQQMDLVYQNSELTLIAAAGNDPSYGLPGVRRRHRSLQPRARIGKHFLVSTLEDPRLCIKRSTWMSRGWTYQEGLLSRRRLIFTDQQVY